ncbi:alpha/beta fold hydrolase [Dictyobacter kobayashii]|nr:alpha/beta fold hydrolase [Dictyobacter kobayashii]
MVSLQQIQNDLKQTRAQLNDIENQRAKLADDKTKEIDARSLDTQAEDLHLHYSQLQSLLAQIELTEAQGVTFLHVAQMAQPANQPAQPNVRFNTLLGSVSGLLFGLLLTFILELFDGHIYSEDELAQLVDWPLLTTIWNESVSKKKGQKQSELYIPDNKDANSEAYRLLRANIGLYQVHQPIRTILVISATPQDGKSTIAANLAIFMARANKRTLLIDADLRRPTLAQKFHLQPDQNGFSDAIQHYATEHTSPKTSTAILEEISTGKNGVLKDYMHAGNIPDLLVMPSGPLPPNPSELLDSKAMDQFMAALKQCECETIIFDTPPLLGLSDTTILLPKVDGVLVVVDIKKASKKNIQRVQMLLGQSESRVLGCIINKHKYNPRELPFDYYHNQSASTVVEEPQKQPARPRLKVEKTARRLTLPKVAKEKLSVQQSMSKQQQQAIMQITAMDTVPSLPAIEKRIPAIEKRSPEGYLALEDGVRLYYKVIGNKPQTLIIPAASWLAADLTALAQEYTLIFYDQRGRGKSDAILDRSKIGMQQDIDDLEAIRQHFNVQHCSLLGWSYLGGTTALYSLQYPTRVKCLILVAPMALRCCKYEDSRKLDPDKRLDPRAIKRLEEMLKKGVDKKDPGTYNREYIKATRLPRQMGKPQALARMKSDPWVSPNEWPDAISAFFDTFARSIGDWDWRARIVTLTIPTLVIHGEEDLVPLSSSQEWVKTLPDSRLLSIPAVGHYPWLESPEIFMPAVIQFIQEQWPPELPAHQSLVVSQSHRSKR